MGRTYRVVDLFAGCGGLTQGFVQTGRFVPVGAVELDQDAAATYRVNFGDHMYGGDIADWLHAGRLPAADVVIGGPPCQGFSNLGTRWSRDPRNALWHHYVDSIQRLRPLAFVLENVPDFLRSAQFEALTRETCPDGRLAGYELVYGILDASKYGVAQKRRRALVIGRLRQLPEIGLPEVTHVEPLTLADILHDVEKRVTNIDLPRPQGPYFTKELHLTRRVTDISRRRFESIPPGGNRFDITPPDLLPPCWQKHRSGSWDVMGRLRWEQPSVTIRTEFYKPEKGRYLHPTEHRPITHFEAALLQGFPRDFLWHGSKRAIGRQIGNAVPIPLAQAIAGHLAAALDEHVSAARASQKEVA